MNDTNGNSIDISFSIKSSFYNWKNTWRFALTTLKIKVQEHSKETANPFAKLSKLNTFNSRRNLVL
ncbi:hypothetical protein GCM10007096_16950 [Pullulanibacillus pueri]|uniref:Uncharacterized protein n=1 Tax=Pullulanibacillus pueri TaxID=1437324 RepID=A0A8J3ELY4_9BACL|nr:hypothetical protein GCM10007096_16950 [Pullulanibacillus pueri]